MKMNYIDLLKFIPYKVKCGKKEKEYLINVRSDNDYVMLSYHTNIYRCTNQNAKREYSLTIPRYISRDNETFEVLGLLQAEMGKTNNGCIVFCNHEYRLINKVINWFDKELEISPNIWRWYIKVNINEPQDKDYKKEIENKVVNYWLSKTKIDLEKNHPKKVSYIKNTKNKELKYYDYGTLIIEYKSNLLSQIIKKYVNQMSYLVPNLGEEEIGNFMRGIIAGESNVEIHKQDKRYRVYISASKKEELELYQKCLNGLGISSKQYQNNKVIISKQKNNIHLLKQKLMCLSPQKYNKFLNMMKLYPNISKETGYFSGKREPHNKIHIEKIEEVLKLSKQNPSWSCQKIAEETGISTIKVARVRKENNIGKRLNKTSKDKIKKVMELHNKNPSAYAYEIANYLSLHKSVVERIRRKYNLRRTKKS